MKIESDDIKKWAEKLEEAGIENMIRSNGKSISSKLTSKELSSTTELVLGLFEKACELAK